MKPLTMLCVAACAVCAGAGVLLAQSSEGPWTDDSYRLGAHDVILVQVWGRTHLSGESALNQAGRILLPLVGEISAAGRTPVELGRSLTERYQLLDPTVTDVQVTVLQYNSRSIALIGELRNPGRHAFEEVPDIWEAILAAGGTTPAADLARVQVVRSEPREGESRVTRVNLSRGVGGTDPDRLPQLRPRDTVIVPSLAEVAVSGDRIQVLGAVRAPGIHRTGAAGTVVEAISASGGALPNADLSKVRLTRPRGGGAIAYELDLHSYLYSARTEADLELEPGDVITVPARKVGLAATMESVARIAPIISLGFALFYAAR